MSEKLNQRPLSPHIQIYRWTLTMALSIMHRATGIALYAGTVILAVWLMSVATGPEAFSWVKGFFSHWFGRLVLFGYSWALFHHMLGGIRHFIWDFGLAFDLKSVETLARISAAAPLFLTGATWLTAVWYAKY
tara:strand:- start:1921 stop:2319 length:399 start_codon:yes stop_codon:yes gene_type:complete